MSKPPKQAQRDEFLLALKKATLEVINDKSVSKRDKNQAVANGAKLLAIEHRIKPGEEGDFFG
jgi:hypothetical protein